MAGRIRQQSRSNLRQFRIAYCSKDIILDIVRIMPKVTSKLQLTVPKKIADQYGIRPGDHLEWIPAGESIRVELMRRKAKDGMRLSPEERLELFDEGTKRLRKREQAVLNGKPHPQPETSGRGWTREELYNDDRGLPRGFPR
jgi:bifunctional DNA-binding transcriptional regulator/antitoxin component of YhaV-PrlF toxin-antitoxin module